MIYYKNHIFSFGGLIMTNERSKRIRLIYGVILSISIVAAGICLMVGCVSIYRTGSHPFSREVVAEVFSHISIPVYLCLALVIGGFILDFVLPADSKKRTAGKQNALVLKRLHAKTDLDQCDEGLRGEILAQQKSRRLHRTICGLLLAVGSVIFLCYTLNGNNFHKSEINDSMIRAMRILLPSMIVPFGYAIFTAYHNAASVEKEIALLKQAGPTGKPAPKEASKDDSRVCKQLAALRGFVIAAAVVLLVYGFLAGGTADVLTKAVNICTECVGLG